MQISKVLSLCALSATVVLGANNLVQKVKDNGIEAIPTSQLELLKLDFFHNPSNNPKTTIKINQRTDQIKA